MKSLNEAMQGLSEKIGRSKLEYSIPPDNLCTGCEYPDICMRQSHLLCGARCPTVSMLFKQRYGYIELC